MSNDLYFEGKKYISAKRAAQISGYADDYIGQLCRAKKLEGKILGRVWFVSEKSLDDYFIRNELNKQTAQEIHKISSSRDGKNIFNEKSEFVYSEDKKPLIPEIINKNFFQSQNDSPHQPIEKTDPRSVNPALDFHSREDNGQKGDYARVSSKKFSTPISSLTPVSKPKASERNKAEYGLREMIGVGSILTVFILFVFGFGAIKNSFFIGDSYAKISSLPVIFLKATVSQREPNKSVDFQKKEENKIFALIKKTPLYFKTGLSSSIEGSATAYHSFTDKIDVSVGEINFANGWDEIFSKISYVKTNALGAFKKMEMIFISVGAEISRFSGLATEKTNQFLNKNQLSLTRYYSDLKYFTGASAVSFKDNFISYPISSLGNFSLKVYDGVNDLFFGARNYFIFVKNGTIEKSAWFAKTFNGNLSGEVGKSENVNFSSGSSDSFFGKVADQFNGFISGTRNYFAGFFGGKNKFADNEIVPIKKTSSSRSSASSSPSVIPVNTGIQAVPNKFDNPQLANPTSSSNTNLDSRLRGNDRVVASDITRREVLDLIKQYDDNSKSLIYATNAITGASSLLTNQSLSDLKNKINSLEQREYVSPRQIDHVYTSIGRSIDNKSSFDDIDITSSRITSSTFSGTTGTFTGVFSGASGTFSSSLTVGSQLTVSGTGTSTLAGDTDFDSGTLYIDSINNRVGIASSSPSETLSVNGATYFSQISSPSVTTDRLYNTSGDLYWNGTVIGSASVGNWTSSGGNVYRSSGNVGIGTTTPGTILSVSGVGNFAGTGSTLYSTLTAPYFTATSTTASTFPYASTTALTVSGNSYLGTVSSGTWNGSLITVPYGGTGWSAIQSGSIPYGNGTSALSTTTAGTSGNILALLNGVPTWTATTTLSDITGTLSVSKGGTGQTSFGQGWLNSDGTTLSASTSPTVAYLTATSTTATSTFAWGVQANALNITSTSATSTFANGIQLSNGCFLMPDGTCAGTGSGSVTSVATNNGLTGGTITTSGTIGLNTAGFITNGLLTWDGSNLVATGTPNLTAGFFTATSTTATSTFAGGMNVAGTAGLTVLQNGNVGVGTTSPNAKLSLYANNGETNTTLFNIASSTASAVSNLFTVLNNGKVGIGTNNPSYTLDVTGTARATSGFYVDSGTILGNGLIGGSYGLYLNNKTIWLNGSGGLVTTGTGKIGIGTTTPYSRLSVWGAGTGTNRLFELTDSASTTLAAFQENGTGYFLGDIGIGTTSPNWKLSVAGNASVDDFVRASYFTATSTTATSTFAWGVQANALNITSTSATSTFANGIQLTNGCFLMPDGTCAGTGSGSVTSIATNNGLTGGTITDSGTIGLNTAGFITNGLLTWDGSNLVATGTPNLTAGFFTATSTTATSTFAGGLSITGTGTGLNFGSDTLFYQNNQRFLTSTAGSNGNLTIGYQSATGLDANGGLYNTGLGYQALGNATSTMGNTALGYQALKGIATISNTGRNTGIGYQALFNNTSGFRNIALGYQAGDSLTSGSSNIILGYDIDAPSPTSSNTLNIGNLIFGTGIDGTGTTLSSGNIGIGTTSPYAKLSVSGDISLDSLFVNFASSSAPSLTLNYLKSATSTIPSNTNYAWSIATSTTASPIFSISTQGSGANVNATTTINGGFNLDNGALTYDYSSGIITVNSLEAGPMSFDNDAGIVTAFDLPIVSASANTVESYSFNIAASSTPNLTVYGESNGSAGVQNQRIGIGTTTPWRTLSVNGTASFSNLTVAVGAGSICRTSTNEITYNAADTCLSSLRATKHDIETLTISGIDTINALESVSFVYNEGYGDDRIRYGFIAEDAASVDSRFASYNGVAISGIDDRAIISVAVKAIKELNLNIQNIASTTATTTPASRSFADSFFSNIFVRIAGWLANATNGIEKLFAKEVRTGKLCLDDVCVTKTELQALLQNASVGGSSASSSSSSSSFSSFSSSSQSSSSSVSSSSSSVSSAQSSSSTPATADTSESSASSQSSSEASSSESSASISSASSETASSSSSNSESSSSSSSEPKSTSDVDLAESSSSSASSVSSETVSSSSSVSSSLSADLSAEEEDTGAEVSG